MTDLSHSSIGNQLRDFVSDYLFTMFASFNIILPMAGFAILIESEEDGWINAIAKSFFYPTYCALIMISWSFIGEKFTESVSYAICLLSVVFIMLNCSSRESGTLYMTVTGHSFPKTCGKCSYSVNSGCKSRISSKVASCSS